MTSTAPNSSSRAPPRPPPSISVSDSSNAVKSVSTSAGSDVARGGPLGIAIPQRQSPDPQSVHSSEDEWSKRTQAAVAASLSAPKLFSTRRGDIDDLLSKLYSEFKNDNREENVFGDMRRYADELAAASVTVVPVGSDGASGERSRVSTESDNRGDPSASSSSPRPAAAIRKRLRRIHCAEGDSEEVEEGGDDHGEEEETSVSAVAAAVSPPHKPPLVSVAAAPATPRDRHGTTAPRCSRTSFISVLWISSTNAATPHGPNSSASLRSPTPLAGKCLNFPEILPPAPSRLCGRGSGSARRRPRRRTVLVRSWRRRQRHYCILQRPMWMRHHLWPVAPARLRLSCLQAVSAGENPPWAPWIVRSCCAPST